MAGCLLYWAEGSKDRNTMHFANSDINLVRFFSLPLLDVGVWFKVCPRNAVRGRSKASSQ